MKFEDNDFGSFSEERAPKTHKEASHGDDKDVRVSSKDDLEANKGKDVERMRETERTDSSVSSNNAESSDNNFGSYSQDRSSDNLSGAKGNNSKKLSEMSSSEKKEALAGDAVDYSTGNYVGIADRHKEDIKDGAKKAAAAKAIEKGTATTARAALITKGINATKGFFQMLGGLAKAVGGKIAGVFVAAGNFLASMLGISATVATFAVGGSAALAMLLAVTMMFNVVTVNMIQKTDDGCLPNPFVTVNQSDVSALAQQVADQAREWANHKPRFKYVLSESAWGLVEEGTGNLVYGTGPGVCCCYFAQLVFWKCGSNVITRDHPIGSCDIMSRELEKYQYFPESEKDIKVGTIILYKAGYDNTYHHASIYIGDGRIAQAASPSSGVLESDNTSMGFAELSYYYPYEIGVSSSPSSAGSSNPNVESESDMAGTSSVSYKDNTSENTTRSQVILRCWGTLKQLGLSDIAAAGVMGNIEQESSFDIDSSGSGGARGLFQYEDNEALKTFCKEKTGDEWNVEAQVEYAINKARSDLKNYSGGNKWYDYNSDKEVSSKPSHESWAWWGDSKYDISTFNNIGGVSLATEVFCRCVERPSKPEMENRITAAEYFYAKRNELNVATGNAKEAALDEDDGCGSTYRGHGVGVEGALKWAEEKANDNRYGYKLWTSDPNTHKCPICNPGSGDGWNCIGFVTAAWYHGGGETDITCYCGGLADNAEGTALLTRGPSYAEDWFNEHNGNHWQVIYNNGNGIPASMLEPGDVLYLYTGSTYLHTAMFFYDDQVVDSTGSSGSVPHDDQIKVRNYSGFYERATKVAFRHVR